MTYQYPVAPQPKKSKTWLWVLLAVVGTVLGLCLVGALVVGGSSSGDKSVRNSVPSVSTSAAIDETAPVTESTSVKLSDFKLTLKVSDKQCFGSAGCSATVDVRVGTALSDQQLAGTYELTYVITGVEDSPVIGTLEITDGDYYSDTRFVDLKSSKSKVVIKATELEKE